MASNCHGKGTKLQLQICAICFLMLEYNTLTNLGVEVLLLNKRLSWRYQVSNRSESRGRAQPADERNAGVWNNGPLLALLWQCRLHFVQELS